MLRPRTDADVQEYRAHKARLLRLYSSHLSRKELSALRTWHKEQCRQLRSLGLEDSQAFAEHRLGAVCAAQVLKG